MLKIVRPDSKGRIALGAFAKGVSSFTITETKDHKIILEPYAEIPAREKWLFENKIALKKIEYGLKDAAAGRIHEKGSFSQFSDDDIE